MLAPKKRKCLEGVAWGSTFRVFYSAPQRSLESSSPSSVSELGSPQTIHGCLLSL